MKTDDPQIIVTGELKEGAKSDLIVFSLRLALFELVCIVNIPPEGETRAPVYCKFKVRKNYYKSNDGGDEEDTEGGS
jgi:hypothetical protein